MAKTGLSFGSVKVLNQNQSYALPNKLCHVTSSAAIESSLDELAWAALAGFATGVVTGAPFIRSTLAGTSVIVKDAGKAGISYDSKSITSSDYIAVGANPAQSGLVRLTNSGGGIKTRNNTGTADQVLISQDASNINIGEGQQTRLWAVLTDLPQGSLAIGANAAQSGAVRLANNQQIKFRNNANTADVNVIQVLTNDNLQINCAGATVFQTNDVSRWYLDSSNLAPMTNDLMSIGTSALKIKTIYAGTSVEVGTNPAQSGAIRLANNQKIVARNVGNTGDVDVIKIGLGNECIVGPQYGPTVFGAVFLKLSEIGDPGVSGVNEGYLYFKDNGAGKTQLMVQFNTGGPIQLAIQP